MIEPYVVERRFRLLRLILVWFAVVVGFFVLWEVVEYFFFPVIPKHVMKQIYLARDLFGAFGGGFWAIWLFLKEDRRYRREKVRHEKMALMQAFSSYILHELRNPMASLSLNAELLREEMKGLEGPQMDELRKSFEAMIHSTERMTDVTERCFRMSRDPQLPKMEFDPIAVLDQLLEADREEALRRNIKVVWVRPEGPPPVVFGSPEGYREALQHLVHNAFDAMPQGGELRISAERRPHALRLRIADTGTGMTREVLERVFDPFFTTKLRGRGLGLSIVYRILEDLKAKVGIRSELDKGTTFQIDLPLLESSKGTGEDVHK